MVETTQTKLEEKKLKIEREEQTKYTKPFSLPCLAMDPTQMDDFRFD